MHARLVFPVRESPDGALVHVARALRRRGYTTRGVAGDRFDLVARRGPSRIVVGLAPHEHGLVALVQCKSLVPGRAARLVDEVTSLLADRLGEPRAGPAPAGGSHG